MKEICVVGSLNIDMAITAPRIPPMGETIHGTGFMTSPGGKGANQAVAAARLGGKVKMIGFVGNDLFGGSLKKNLEENGIDTGLVGTAEGVPTGVAVIVVKEGDNFIILDSGANNSNTAESVKSSAEAISGADMVLLQHEIPQAAVEKAIELARANGTKVLLNPAPARPLEDRLLKQLDIIVPNESECAFITGLPVNSVSDAEKSVEFLMKKGVPQVVVTMGEKGVIYNRNEEIVYKQAQKVEPVDTTAAGDSFIGALAVALTSGKSIDEAVDFAGVVAAVTITRRGAQFSIPFLNELDNYMGGMNTAVL